MPSLREMGFDRLTDYEVSEGYQARRDLIWREQGEPGCFVCGRADVQMHHRSYRRLGEERASDLVALCEDHHYEVERRIKAGRYARSTAHLNYLAECQTRSYGRLRPMAQVLAAPAPVGQRAVS